MVTQSTIPLPIPAKHFELCIVDGHTLRPLTPGESYGSFRQVEAIIYHLQRSHPQNYYAVKQFRDGRWISTTAFNSRQAVAAQSNTPAS